jgi:hypothetical protein
MRGLPAKRVRMNTNLMNIEDLRPGQRVRVTQTIDRREPNWCCQVVGVVQAVELGKTGSWYAHSKDDKFWLRRIRLLKDDGEVTLVNLDQWTEVELLP